MWCVSVSCDVCLSITVVTTTPTETGVVVASGTEEATIEGAVGTVMGVATAGRANGGMEVVGGMAEMSGKWC